MHASDDSSTPSAADFGRAESIVKRLREEVARTVVGQHELIDGLLVGLLCGGHVLVEGVPGLAKTTAIRTLAAALGLGFRRVQFTPDLLPGDLTGSPVFVPDRQTFEVRRGPIFTPVLLADEINRAPAKVQSALLEAMEERQVTIGDQTFPLPDPFLVMATQNPVELEGTYPLPEAQVDRFMTKLVVGYPSADEEREIVARDGEGPREVRAVCDAAQVRMLRATAGTVFAAPEIVDYAVRIVRATRDADALSLPGAISLGGSPRASIYLVRAARAAALLGGRRFASPDDVKQQAPPVLRHRVWPSYEAEADGIDADRILRAALESVEAP